MEESQQQWSLRRNKLVALSLHFLLHKLSLNTFVTPVQLKVGLIYLLMYLFIFKLTTEMNLENLEQVIIGPLKRFDFLSAFLHCYDMAVCIWALQTQCARQSNRFRTRWNPPPAAA